MIQYIQGDKEKSFHQMTLESKMILKNEKQI